MVYYLVVQIQRYIVKYVSCFSAANYCCKGESDQAGDMDMESSRTRGEEMEMNTMHVTQGNNDAFR